MTEIPAALGLSSEQVEGLLTAAGLAPSLHNSQPWRFRITPHVIELHADPERALPVIDPDGIEQRIACGAALFNLRLALHGHGIRPIVAILPDGGKPGLLATVRHGGSKRATPEQERLLRAVPLRRTNRHPFTDIPVTSDEHHALRRAALEEGAWLYVVDDTQQRIHLQELAARAHKTQLADPAFVAELRHWIGVPPGRDEGVPVGAGPRPAPHDRWVLRDFTGGLAPERVEGKDFEDQPLIAVLTSRHSGTAADIHSGEALQRVLLTATAHGLATSFLSQIIEVPETREELRRVIGGTRAPQSVLRIGRGWPVPAVPRRPAIDLLVPSDLTAPTSG